MLTATGVHKLLSIISSGAQRYMGISPGKITNDVENINSRSSFNSEHTDLQNAQIMFLLEGTHTQSPQNSTRGKRNVAKKVTLFQVRFVPSHLFPS